MTGVLCAVCAAMVYFCMLVKQMWLMVLIYTFNLFKIVFFYPDNSSKTLKRPCPFCGKFLAKLKRHLISNHSKEEEVSNALKLPKHLQNRQFANMRKAGIFKVNAEKMKSEDKINEVKLIRERNHGEGALTICSFCKGVYQRASFYRHVRVCARAQSELDVPKALKITQFNPDPEYSTAYQREILDCFVMNEVGQVIQKDTCIKDLGQQEFRSIQESDKKGEKRQSLMASMRILGRLLLAVQKIAGDKNIEINSCTEMFSRNNINFINEAIRNLSTEESHIKPGTKMMLRQVIQKATSMLILKNLINKDDKNAEEMQKFKSVLELSWPSFFSSAQENIMKRRQTELRKPENLPSKDTINKIRDFIEKRVEEYSNEYERLSHTDYCDLRDALVTRLTLFNARRGGEPSRMTINELQDALDDKWVDKTIIDKITDDLDKHLINKLKIAYIHSSKSNKVVPVIIPKDCIRGLKKLIDTEERKAAGVRSGNNFVFAHTQASESHVVGWQCVNKICVKSGVQQKLNATKMRHYIATEYALLDVDPQDREIFYTHMGHSQGTNEKIYQCPPAVKELVHVGKFFLQIDSKGNLIY